MRGGLTAGWAHLERRNDLQERMYRSGAYMAVLLRAMGAAGCIRRKLGTAPDTGQRLCASIYGGWSEMRVEMDRRIGR